VQSTLDQLISDMEGILRAIEGNTFLDSEKNPIDKDDVDKELKVLCRCLCEFKGLVDQLMLFWPIEEWSKRMKAGSSFSVKEGIEKIPPIARKLFNYFVLNVTE
jgi:hypothetical protein